MNLKNFTRVLLICALSANSAHLFAVEPEKSASTIFKDYANSIVMIQSSAGLGSGFIIGEGDLVVTNYHVVANAEVQAPDILVAFKSGKQVRPLGVVAYDIMRDLCVLRIPKMDPPVVPLKLGNSTSIEIGEKVYAIGNPLGQNYSISDGIVSQVLPGDFMKTIQFTAPISSGNSGGPLIDAQGRVIAVVSQAVMPTEGAIVQNMNYAVSSDSIRFILASLTEIDLDDFFQAVKFNAPFLVTWQSLPQTSLNDQYLHLQEAYNHLCSDMNGKNCYFLYEFTIAFSAQLMKGYQASKNDEAAGEWAQISKALVDQAGGVDKLSVLFKRFFSSSDADLRNARENVFTAGASYSALSDPNKWERLKNYQKIKSVTSQSQDPNLQLMSNALRWENMVVMSDINLDAYTQSPSGWPRLKGTLMKGTRFRIIADEGDKLTLVFEADVEEETLAAVAVPLKRGKSETRYRLKQDFVASGNPGSQNLEIYGTFKSGCEFKTVTFSTDEKKQRAMFFLFLEGTEAKDFKAKTTL